jgi:hypothetical protein
MSDGSSTSWGRSAEEFGDYTSLVYLGRPHFVWADSSNSTFDNPDAQRMEALDALLRKLDHPLDYYVLGKSTRESEFDAYTDQIVGVMLRLKAVFTSLRLTVCALTCETTANSSPSEAADRKSKPATMQLQHSIAARAVSRRPSVDNAPYSNRGAGRRTTRELSGQRKQRGDGITY